MKIAARRSRSRLDEMTSEAFGAAPETPSADAVGRVAAGPLFEGLTTAEVAAIAERFEEAHFLPGHRMVVEGLRGSDFYLIVEGRASVLVESWPVAELGPGAYFGEMAVLGDGLRSASVRADTPLRCLVLSNGGLEQLVLEHPQLGINLLRTMIDRLRATSHAAVGDRAFAAG